MEYVYTRDSTGRVVSVDSPLKIPRNKVVDFVYSYDENGDIVEAEFRFKKTGKEDNITNVTWWR